MPVIRRIDIANFRSLKEITLLPSAGINCLIGRGDSGKSSVLDAIDFCLGSRRNLQVTDTDFHQMDVSQPIRILVDEYQDCSLQQHGIVYFVANLLPTCVVGDPLQAIFGFGDDALADWNKHVCQHFPLAGELHTPWRWINAGTEGFGRWLLDVRSKLLKREPINLTVAPDEVSWVQLFGTAEDYSKLLKAGRAKSPGGSGSVVIIGESTSPQSQQKFASQTPGAETVEAVDLRDLVKFAVSFDVSADDALEAIGRFAESVMTNVGASDLVQRVKSLKQGTARREASDVENAALAFEADRSHRRVVALLVEMNKEAGTRVYRPAVLRACNRALYLCATEKSSFPEAVLKIREQNRAMGRALPGRSVGSTLTLKGLEAEVAVVLTADDLNSRNLYVAMTRGSKKLILCSKNKVLKPSW